MLSKEGERFEFKCPRRKYFKDGKKKTGKRYEKCWFQLAADHINIMDIQKIKREDIIDSWIYHGFYLPYSQDIRCSFLYKLNGTIKRIEIQPLKIDSKIGLMNQNAKMTEAFAIWQNR